MLRRYSCRGTVVIYLSLLLHIQQTLIVGESRGKLSSRSQHIAVFVMASCGLVIVFSFFLTEIEHPDRVGIVREVPHYCCFP
ncbi:hypothetical protein PMAYCL1PPCAC_26286 [Pristionchus mayeri]|uniref:G protein-coupled receptor n=1 Tax=Pristionchus mayeri TaxID=1317129 RepID=A0AAN5D3E9_9BILA|nr:hypothetical protein PMAYCL1PPCAC_26286 [Pristionchus mayeri]